MQRAVDRGLARRPATLTPVLGVDEKSFQGREFVTVVCDLDGGTVLHVADGRGSEALKSCYAAMTEPQREAVEAVAMDMHQPYVLATQNALPDATIVFDKFHIAKLAGEAVDQVRRAEAKKLAAEGDDRLKGTRYSWLRNPLDEDAERVKSSSRCGRATSRPHGRGPSGDVDGLLPLQAGEAGQRLLSRMVWLGEPLKVAANGAAGPHPEEPPRHTAQLLQVADHQRGQRSPELENPVDQIHRPRLPQP